MTGHETEPADRNVSASSEPAARNEESAAGEDSGGREDPGTAARPPLDPAGRDSAQIRLREMAETERKASRETAAGSEPRPRGDQT